VADKFWDSLRWPLPVNNSSYILSYKHELLLYACELASFYNDTRNSIFLTFLLGSVEPLYNLYRLEGAEVYKTLSKQVPLQTSAFGFWVLNPGRVALASVLQGVLEP